MKRSMSSMINPDLIKIDGFLKKVVEDDDYIVETELLSGETKLESLAEILTINLDLGEMIYQRYMSGYLEKVYGLDKDSDLQTKEEILLKWILFEVCKDVMRKHGISNEYKSVGISHKKTGKHWMGSAIVANHYIPKGEKLDKISLIL